MAAAPAAADVARTECLAQPMLNGQTAFIADYQMEKQQIVGAAVGVIRDGQIVYVTGYGLADGENEAPVMPRTVFNGGEANRDRR